MTESSLLDLLKLQFPESSTTTLRSWIEQGRVQVGGKILRRANHSVKKDELITLHKKVQFLPAEMRLLYEDNDLIVIDKPEGLLSVGLDYGAAINAHTLLKKRAEGRVFPVHRLDRDTSGVMVFAYTEKARNSLKRQFEEHSIEREYLALLEGKLPELKGTWESFLQEDRNYKMHSGAVGKKSVTHFEVIEHRKWHTLVRFRLETGRKNQIRVHAQDAGHPIAGDKKYGAKTNPLKRLCLHAHKLGFIHPKTGKLMRFESPFDF